jgi:hypothetical protein
VSPRKGDEDTSLFTLPVRAHDVEQEVCFLLLINRTLNIEPRHCDNKGFATPSLASFASALTSSIALLP